MKIRRGTALTAAAAVLMSLVGATAGIQGASATGTTPTYYPDAGSIGTITLYNASGTQITSGSVDDSPLAAYYKASGPKIPGFTNNFGFVAYATPQDGVAPQSWTTVEQWTSAQNYTTAQASYPVGLNDATTNVVIKAAGTDGPMSTHITAFPSASVANPGVYQIRMLTSAANAATYYTADIKVTGSTWTQVYPAVVLGTATATTIQTSSSGPLDGATPVTLTATVSPAAAGSVTFQDGVTDLGAADSYNAGTGIATKTVTPTTAGLHHFNATFASADSSAFQSSSTQTSADVTVTLAQVTPTVTLALSPSHVAFGTARSATVTVTGGSPTGAVSVKEGATVLGEGTLSAGSATIALTRTLAPGVHKVVASYAGNNTVAAGSSSVVPLTVTKAGSAIKVVLAKVTVKKKLRKAFLVTLTAAGVQPSGRVTIYQVVKRKSVKVGLGLLRSGKTVIVLPALKKGTYTFVVSYGGSTYVLGSSKKLAVKF